MAVPENSIVFPQSVNFQQVRATHSRLMHLVEFRGYEKIKLDFSDTNLLFQENFLPIAALSRRLQKEGVEFDLVLPNNHKLRRLFENANWAHLISPGSFKKSEADVWNNMSAREFLDPSEQSKTVDYILDKILKAVDFLTRTDFRALEWSLQEITDNVLQHCNSESGGLVQLSIHPNSKELEFTVSDAGDGVLGTLRSAYPHLKTDAEALQEAVKEGVTRGTGQGNGLFGSFQICALSGAPFAINSGKGALFLDNAAKALVKSYDDAIIGCTVMCKVSFARPLLLENSLKIAGRPFNPSSDLIELSYEMNSDEFVEFDLASEARSVGSRLAGNEIRTKLTNLLNMTEGKPIVVNATNVGIMSSSFADEAFSKLSLSLGQEVYRTRVRFQGLQPINEAIIQRSIQQRIAKGL